MDGTRVRIGRMVIGAWGNSRIGRRESWMATGIGTRVTMILSVLFGLLALAVAVV